MNLKLKKVKKKERKQELKKALKFQMNYINFHWDYMYFENFESIKRYKLTLKDTMELY